MIYYILLPGDTEADTLNDSNILGEVSFKRFKKNDGFNVLLRVSKQRPELLEEIRIYDSSGKKHTVEQFLNIFEKYNNYK